MSTLLMYVLMRTVYYSAVNFFCLFAVKPRLADIEVN